MPLTFSVHLPDPLPGRPFSFVITKEQAGILQCIYLAYDPASGDGKGQIGISFIRDEAPFAAGQCTDQLPSSDLRHLFWIPSMIHSSTPGGLISIYQIPKDIELKAGDRIVFATSKISKDDKFRNIFLTLTNSPEV